jgi:hypothetical protein
LCTLCPTRDISLDGQSIQQAWKRSEIQTGLWLENLKERNHLKVVGGRWEDNFKMDLQ